MIKVIKNGKYINLPKIKLTTKCILCGCSFEFELEDLELSYIRFSDGDVDLKFSIFCPQCQSKESYDYYKLCDSIYESNDYNIYFALFFNVIFLSVTIALGKAAYLKD